MTRPRHRLRAPRPPGARDDTKDFIARVLGDTEDTWSTVFKRMGREYHPPKLELFLGAVDSACGLTSSAVGPSIARPTGVSIFDRSFLEDLS